jgi:hypothetical protein
MFVSNVKVFPLRGFDYSQWNLARPDGKAAGISISQFA